MIGNKTMMDYLAHRLGIRDLTEEDVKRLESGDLDKTIVDSRDYFKSAKKTEQQVQADSPDGPTA